MGRYKTQTALDHKAGSEDEQQGEVLRNLQESMQLSSFMASLVLKAVADLTFARRRYCVTQSPGLWAALSPEFRPWKMWKGHKETMGIIGTRTATRLNSPTGTRLAFRQRGGGSLPCTKAYWKGVCPKEQCQGFLQLGSSWLGDLRRGVTLIDFTPLQKGGAGGDTLEKATARAMAQVRWRSSG